MSDVGIRELKANLSKYLERAARGETIRVLDRGRPKAVLGPLPGRLRLDEGVAEGWVRGPLAAARGPWRRFAASRSVSAMLEEDRGA
jgi:prevent-host-death family protein